MKKIMLSIVMCSALSACAVLPAPLQYTFNRLEPKIYHQKKEIRDYVMGKSTLVEKGESVFTKKKAKIYSKMSMAMNDSKQNLCEMSMEEIMKMSAGFEGLKESSYEVYDDCNKSFYVFREIKDNIAYIDAYYDIPYGGLEVEVKDVILLHTPDKTYSFKITDEYTRSIIDGMKVAHKVENGSLRFVVVNDNTNPSLPKDGEVEILD